MPKTNPHEAQTNISPNGATPERLPLPDPSAAGLKPVEFGQYGMRTNKEGGHGSDHGAVTDHETFDDEFSTREARNHRARTLPNGLADEPAKD